MQYGNRIRRFRPRQRAIPRLFLRLSGKKLAACGDRLRGGSKATICGIPALDAERVEHISPSKRAAWNCRARCYGKSCTRRVTSVTSPFCEGVAVSGREFAKNAPSGGNP